MKNICSLLMVIPIVQSRLSGKSRPSSAEYLAAHPELKQTKPNSGDRPSSAEYIAAHPEIHQPTQNSGGRPSSAEYLRQHPEEAQHHANEGTGSHVDGSAPLPRLAKVEPKHMPPAANPTQAVPKPISSPISSKKQDTFWKRNKGFIIVVVAAVCSLPLVCFCVLVALKHILSNMNQSSVDNDVPTELDIC